jgi:hypothetical protein
LVGALPPRRPESVICPLRPSWLNSSAIQDTNARSHFFLQLPHYLNNTRIW